MKFVAIIFGNLKRLRIYHLPNWISTAIEVSLPILPLWIRILVRLLKKSIIILLIYILDLELYSKLCTIEVDLSHLRGTSDLQAVGKGYGLHYIVYYDLVMLFGGTEIEAQLSWKEKVRSTIFLLL